MYKKIIIGREPSCDIVVEPEYSQVSGRHATMYVDTTGEIIFEDISRNGSIVNGTPVNNESVKVAFGAPIVLGDNYNLSWQKIQPLLYRGPQTSASNVGSSSVPNSNVPGSNQYPTGNQNIGYGAQNPLCPDPRDINSQPTATQMPSSAGYQQNPYPDQACQSTPQQGSYQYGAQHNQQNSYGQQPYYPAQGYGQAQMPFNQMPSNQMPNVDVYQVDPVYLTSWNWGAFFLMPIWGFGNGCWWLFFLMPFCPLANIIIAIFANRLAWKCKRWDNFYQFKTAQQTWSKGGIIGFIFGLVIVLFYFMVFVTFFSSVSY